jgi:hypothetical protein
MGGMSLCAGAAIPSASFAFRAIGEALRDRHSHVEAGLTLHTLRIPMARHPFRVFLWATVFPRHGESSPIRAIPPFSRNGERDAVASAGHASPGPTEQRRRPRRSAPLSSRRNVVEHLDHGHTAAGAQRPGQLVPDGRTELPSVRHVDTSSRRAPRRPLPLAGRAARLPGRARPSSSTRGPQSMASEARAKRTIDGGRGDELSAGGARAQRA